MKKITVFVNGDKLAEADETFEIILSNPSGASLSNNIGTVTIVNDDSRTDNFPLYEVRFTFTGFTSFLGGLKDCPVRPNGKVIMTGLLTGREKVTADEDITYTGTLQMDMDLDICTASVDDFNDTCRITVIGSGLVPAELKISFDGRGAYIILGKASDRFMKNVSGTCDKGQIDEERTMVPDKTIASVFNGTDLAMLVNRTLRVGRYVQLGDDDEIEIVVEVLRKIKP